MIVDVKPVTRIEGHLQVHIEIEKDDVKVQLRAGGFRGFEKILVGRPIEEAVHIAPRICGVCSVAHHLASAKAVDNVLSVEIPKAAQIVREVMGLGGIIQSHLLHLGFLSYPDIERGRNVYRVEIWRSLVALYNKATHIVNISGGRHVHPFNAVPGGVLKIPPREDIDAMMSEAESGLKLLGDLYGELRSKIERFVEENVNEIAYTKSSLAALTKNGEISFYEGVVRAVDENGDEAIVQPSECAKFIVEEPVNYSYSKRVYALLGGAKRAVRVGPISRLSLPLSIHYDMSKKFYGDFKSVIGKWGLHPLIYNLARVVEVTYCFEKMLSLLSELKTLPATPRTKVSLKEGEGVGVVEAPRGLLVHHYKSNKDGIITYANIITPTTINLTVMEEDVRETVKLLIDKYPNTVEHIKEKVLYLIRSYDPCVSCATHAIHITKR